MLETCVRSLGQEDPQEKGMATHSSILDWRIPWTEELGGLQSMGLQRVGHDGETNTFTFQHLTKIICSAKEISRKQFFHYTNVNTNLFLCVFNTLYSILQRFWITGETIWIFKRDSLHSHYSTSIHSWKSVRWSHRTVRSWIFIGRTDAEAETPILWPPDVKNWLTGKTWKRLTGKDPDAGKDWRQEDKRTTEDEMVGWHHRLNGHEFE